MPSNQRGGLISRLLSRLGAGPEVEVAAARGAQAVERGTRTFQGRPIVKVMWKGREVDAVRGLIAYKVRDPLAAVAPSEAGDALGGPVLGSSAPDELGIGVIDTDAHIESDAAVTAADSLGQNVLWTEPVLIERGALNPNDFHFSQQWGLPRINAPRAWDIWHGDPNHVVLAILDSGIAMQANRLSHPDLSDEERIAVGPDLVNNDAEPKDDHGHGTHVAGLAAATKNDGTGVAGLWPGSVLIVKVFNSVNLEGSTVVFKEGVKAAVEFARQRGARLVINYSGGGEDTGTKREAVAHARDNNALVVASAGNASGGDITFPAAYSTEFSNVIAVGAVNRDNERPDFASRGPEMTVVAPGDDIISTLPNYIVTLNTGVRRKEMNFDRLSGTSQAAPLVAALAALIWSQAPQLSAPQVRDRITQTATPIDGSAFDFGHGLINAEAALS
jgi:thermitase